MKKKVHLSARMISKINRNFERVEEASRAARLSSIVSRFRPKTARGPDVRQPPLEPQAERRSQVQVAPLAQLPLVVEVIKPVPLDCVTPPKM